MQKGELIGELNTKVVATVVDDIAEGGIRLSMNAEGTFSGKHGASHIDTTRVFQKTDGTLEWESEAIETTSGGDMYAVKGSGSGKVTGSTKMDWEGELVYTTRSSRLDRLNGTKGWVEGTIDRSKNEIHAKIYALK
jgi:hypothetical protein